MNNLVLASASSLVASPAELVVLATTIFFLSLRAWIGVSQIHLDQFGSRMLTGLTIFFMLVFFTLVVLRFKILG